MKYGLIIWLLLVPLVGVPQLWHHVSADIDHQLQKVRHKRKDSIHTALKPLHPLDRRVLPTTVSEVPTAKNKLYQSQFKMGKNWQVYPLADLRVGVDLSSASDKTPIRGTLGAGVLWQTNKWSAGLNYLAGYEAPVAYMRYLSDSMDIIPNMGFARELGDQYWYQMPTGHLNFTPDKHFSFELGNGKHFIGNGYRSFLLSDNAAPHPYFKIDTKVWRIRYTNLYSWQYDIRGANGDFSQVYNKFSTNHYLDWNVTNDWSIGLFESVIWQGKDTLLNRGYDINYLNPIIFYRPIEFAQGSADNAIIGLNTQVKITDQHHWYMQFVIDEFLLSAMRADVQHFFRPKDTTIEHGWWANKYAFQMGYKWFDVGKVPGLDLQVEFNLARPFIYSHGSVYQNYAHFNQPLAHPRGANFYEFVAFIRYQRNRLKVTNQFIWSGYGLDQNDINYGGDVYERYIDRVGEYEHYIGQGERNSLIYNDVQVSWVLNPVINLEAMAGFRMRIVSNLAANSSNNMVYIGLRTKLWQRYEDM